MAAAVVVVAAVVAVVMAVAAAVRWSGWCFGGEGDRERGITAGYAACA